MERNKKMKIAAIDDEPEICWLITRILEEEGHIPLVADNGLDGLAMVQAENPDVVFLDLRLPGMDGLEVLRKIREFDKQMMVIILSAFESFEAAVQAMKLGSYDFLTKPINVEEMKITLRNALRTKKLVSEVETLKRQAALTWEAKQIIGNCPEIQNIYRQIELASQHNIAVLILGESGTGKELLAKAVHFNSTRKKGPFICIDCSTIPENLIESELFGYEKGAFTGAQERKIGRLEMADQGTLFLDEIGNMPLAMQMKLLRVIQERVIYRLGGKIQIPIDLRLITATNLDLKQSIRSGLFREDFFYRLNEFPLHIPPLRERGDDIQILAKFFLDKFNREFQKQITEISPEAHHCLATHPWPGNVRELQAVIKRGVILAVDQLRPEHLPSELSAGHKPKQHSFMIEADLDEIRPIKEVSKEVVSRIERRLIQRALEKSGNNKVKTAKWLGIDYKTLFNKLKQYHIERESHPEDTGSEPVLPYVGEQNNLRNFKQF
ncbi:sigma-54 dependent transcriptional regulator [bacterium]|nr:sigma-54 dependent transcriptional regulator [bacterium]